MELTERSLQRVRTLTELFDEHDPVRAELHALEAELLEKSRDANESTREETNGTN